MTNAVIIISKEPHSSNKSKLGLKILSKITEKVDSASLFLIEDGVYLAREASIDTLVSTGVTVKAEEWDLKARGLKGKINTKVEVTDTEDLLTEISEKNEIVLWF